MVSSCCGVINLQKACIITSSIEIVLSCAFLFYCVVVLAVETPLAVEERKNAVETPDLNRFHAMRVILSGMNGLFWIGCLFLGFILMLGAKQRDLRRLRSWFVLTCILTVLFVVDIFIEAFSMTAPIPAIISPILGTILQCYMLWIVMEFMEEVAHGGCASIPIKAQVEDA
ncbi:unnamed protein product [Orchesella dallaii]|uniref:Uncharacterized protein n=1 Tax=Orchesella dallaii TaxID=48710 RepID=A0ABP1QA31_9HEXA